MSFWKRRERRDNHYDGRFERKGRRLSPIKRIGNAIASVFKGRGRNYSTPADYYDDYSPPSTYDSSRRGLENEWWADEDWENEEKKRRKKKERRKRKIGKMLEFALTLALLGGAAVYTAPRVGGWVKKYRSPQQNKPYLPIPEPKGRRFKPGKQPTPNLGSKKPNRPIAHSTHPTETATPQTKETFSQKNFVALLIPGSGKLMIDPETHIPVKFVTLSGKETKIDPKNFLKAKEEARLTGVPISFLFQAVPTNMASNEKHDSSPHPVYERLPKNFLTAKQLEKKYHTRIIQADQIGIKLAISNRAFLPDGPLAPQAEHPEYQTTVVLVPGPILDQSFLKDPKYDSIRRLIRKNDAGFDFSNPIQLKEQLNKIYSDQISETEQQIEQLKEKESDQAELLGYELDSLLEEQRLLNNKTTPDQQIVGLAMREAGREGNLSKAVGLWVFERSSKKITVFVCVKPLSNKNLKDMMTLRVSGNGQISAGTSIISLVNQSSYRPLDESQSQMNPDLFARNPDASPENARSYPIGAQTIGFAIEHEVSHNELIIKQMEPIYENGQIVGWKIRETPYFYGNSEYDTDMRAYERMKNAYEKWIKTGDNSGFIFAFTLPDGPDKGKWILTKHTPQPQELTQRPTEYVKISTPKSRSSATTATTHLPNSSLSKQRKLATTQMQARLNSNKGRQNRRAKKPIKRRYG